MNREEYLQQTYGQVWERRAETWYGCLPEPERMGMIGHYPGATFLDGEKKRPMRYDELPEYAKVTVRLLWRREAKIDNAFSD